MTGTPPPPAGGAGHQGTRGTQGLDSGAAPQAPDDSLRGSGHGSTGTPQGHAATHAPQEHDSGSAPQDDGDAAGDDRARRRAGRALVVTASNRAAAGVYADQGGPLITGCLEAIGFIVDGPRVVPDGDPVEQALRDGVRAGYDVIVTTGGTGISPTDGTPEATRKVVDHEVPGIAEAIRAFGRQKVATASLSRGLAGVAGRTLIVNLPGSTGGVKDGLAVLQDLLPHAVEQLRGGDHPGSSSQGHFPRHAGSGGASPARVGTPPHPEGSGEVPPGGAH